MAMVRRVAILSALLLVVPAAAAADSARFAPVNVPATDLSDATGAVAMSAAGLNGSGGGIRTCGAGRRSG